jgi:hypothetical protein
MKFVKLRYLYGLALRIGSLHEISISLKHTWLESF